MFERFGGDNSPPAPHLQGENQRPDLVSRNCGGSSQAELGARKVAGA